ncbi:MucR family transcriptional regulator [Ornithinimicrobium cryptoxanthini]|uniref:MucR family transcriptional regulator n=1 Tax=Ornithinimicrobium cryptoxanthini TaxID=2934161 RepID=UPI002118FB76|nr:MucR family transcriptional regulator [Ornithinimicrobium cryptoxanthini]
MSSEVGDPDGFGVFGVLNEDTDGLLCHDCGHRFTHLGLHAYKAHGMTADEYRKAHGLARRGLVVAETRATIKENARRTFSSRVAFIAARNPAAASAAQRGGPDSISPAGLAAIRETARTRRGTQRLGTVVTCEWCGAQFCPLLGASKRRFCCRSCSSRHNRGQRGRPAQDT